MTTHRLVIVESPFAGKAPIWSLRFPRFVQNLAVRVETWRNIRYARAAIRDCLLRDEAPLASHLLYTQRGVLDDNIPRERQRGILAGIAWGKGVDATVVYIDRGVSKGMSYGITCARVVGRPVEYRSLCRKLPPDDGHLKCGVTSNDATSAAKPFAEATHSAVALRAAGGGVVRLDVV